MSKSLTCAKVALRSNLTLQDADVSHLKECLIKQQINPELYSVIISDQALQLIAAALLRP